MALQDDVLAELSGDKLAALAQQAGVDPAQAEQVVRAGLPALLGGMASNVEQPGGADSLANALSDHADSNPLDNIAALGAGGIGGGILDHILGGAQGGVSDALGQKTGAGAGNTQKLLTMIAPIVLSMLAKKFAQGGQKADPGAVADEVKKSNAKAKQDQPDIGDLLGGLFGGR